MSVFSSDNLVRSLIVSAVLGCLVPATSWAASSAPGTADPATSTLPQGAVLLKSLPAKPVDPANGNSNTPGAAPDPSTNGSSPNRPSHGRKPARSVFYRLNAQCLTDGARLRLTGKGFSREREGQFSLSLKDGLKERLLPLLSRTETEIVTELPRGFSLEYGRKYQLLLKSGGLLVAGEGNRTRFEKCAANVAPEQIKPSSDLYVEGEILILLPKILFNQLAVDQMKADLVQEGYQVLKESNLAALGFVLLQMRIPDGTQEETILQALKGRYPNATIDYNHRNQLSGSPRVYADKLINRATATGGCPVLQNADLAVGVIDGGVDLKHHALQGQRDIRTAGFAHGGAGLPKPSDHGTAITVLFKGNNAADGYSGLLPKAPIFVADILTQKTGKPFAATSSFVEGLNWLVGRKVKMINMSLEGPRNLVMNQALDKMIDRDIYLFAAAGNGGKQALPPFPAAHPAVMGVTAVDRDMNIYRKATPGGHVDFSAPGVMLWLAKAGGRGSYRSGTSFAVPYVIAKSAYLMNKKPALMTGQGRVGITAALSEEVIDLGEIGRDPVFGQGLIQFSNC